MTPTDICNLALDLLKEAPITSIEEARPIARWCKRNFDVTRDALLEESEWNFAIKRASLAASPTAPEFGRAYSFTRPADCIRLLPPQEMGGFDTSAISYEPEGQSFLADTEGPLYVRYVSRLDDYSKYPATFITALSARMAVKMAHWLTGKSNYVQIAEGVYRDAMNKAWLSDAVQGTMPGPYEDGWIDAR